MSEHTYKNSKAILNASSQIYIKISFNVLPHDAQIAAETAKQLNV